MKKTLTTAEWRRMVEFHQTEVLKVYGPRRFRHTNIGWGKMSNQIDSLVCSLYHKPCMIVSTTRYGRGYKHKHTKY